MQLKNKNTGSFWALAAIASFAAVAPGCGDGDETGSAKGGTGGQATGGKAGSGVGGNTGGSAGLGGTAGKAGSSGTAGTAGTAGSAGTAGTAGTAGSGGIGGEGGEGGEGTMGGEGGQGGTPPVTIYDFETDTQGWASDPPTVVAVSADQHVDGAKSLKVTYQTLDNANVSVAVTNFGPALWPGTVLTIHAFLPAGLDTTGGTYFQMFSQGNNYATFDTNGNSSRTAASGAFTTWTYTIPNMFPGGFQKLGFQLGDNPAGGTIAAGDVYLDAITMTGGNANCAIATPTQAHDFEGASLDPNVYQKDGTDADTVASQSTEQANGGTHSWKVDFTALPAPATGQQTTRRVYVNNPNLYCGQTATVRVFLPTGSDGMTFQVFAQYNNYAKFNGSATPVTVTRNGWTTLTYQVPATGTDAVGPGGIQRIGVQFLWSGTTAFTGAGYIDDITWGP